jgi:hypothetical protein
MGRLEFKRNKSNYEINLFAGKNSNSHYQNIIDRDPQKIAQILIDLHLDGFPIEKAVKLFLKRIKERDWLGL